MPPSYLGARVLYHTVIEGATRGRQYRYEFDTDGAVADWSITGGYRSGRAHTEGVLSITDTEHPVIVRGHLEAAGEEETVI